MKQTNNNNNSKNTRKLITEISIYFCSNLALGKDKIA